MTKRHTPPGLKSNALVVVRKPSGPHHFPRCFGSVHTDQTSSRGASSSREPPITFGSQSRSILFVAAAFVFGRRRPGALEGAGGRHAGGGGELYGLALRGVGQSRVPR